jgi:hypothetical protein
MAYGLDPCHYFTAPGLSWDAFLKKTNANLELLTNIDDYMFFEQAIRGGICMISKRYARANNKYMKSFDPSKPSKFIAYLDANALYSWSMTQLLPNGGFRWLSDDEIASFDAMAVDDNGPKGYFLECDIEYPAHLHDLHNDYPLCPVNNLRNRCQFELVNNERKLLKLISRPIAKLS